MTTKLTDFQNAIETAWQAVTPFTDGSAEAYAFIDDLVEERGNGQHREIIWGRPQQAEPEATGMLQLRWAVDATLFLHRNDRTQEAFHQAQQTEIVDLLRAFANAVLPAGVLEAIYGTVTNDDNPDESPKRAGGIRRSLVARIVFPFSVLTAEV